MKFRCTNDENIPALTSLNESCSSAELGKAKIVNDFQHTRPCLSY